MTTTDTGEIIVTNNEHCHTEIRQHLKKDYKNKLMLNALTQFSQHLSHAVLPGNGQLDNNANDAISDNGNIRPRSPTPPTTSNGSWNLKKEIN